MHNPEDRTCYLCMELEDNYDTYPYLEKHHIIHGTANRRLSEDYGLYVWLCYRHHNDFYSPVAVHNNHEIDEALKRKAQVAFIEHFPDNDFMSVFGKSYL